MAQSRPIIVSSFDYERLRNLFNSDFTAAYVDKQYLLALRKELDQATIVDPVEIPSDVITMNSIVNLRDVRSLDLDTFTLVFPEEADIAEGKLSVLAPIGTAILGYRVGDLVRWYVPSGMIRFRIEELVFQPEREGVVA